MDDEAPDTRSDTGIPDLEPEEPISQCGNGTIDEDENCDGDDLGGMTCEGLGYDGGTLACTLDCTYDESRCGNLPECVRYVDIDTTAFSPDGLSWATAVPTVQHGIELAADVAVEEVPCDVWVAEGTYYIHQSDPHDTVQLRPHVHLYGGFDGTEELRVERDWEAHETILDGHSSTDEHIVYHVVTGSDYSVIDGCTITGGKAVGGEVPHHFGGGMLNFEASPIVRNCRIEHNQAGDEGYGGVGGGVYSWHASPRFEKCRFVDNRAFGGSGYGGAISSWEGGSLEVADCEFSDNRGKFGGAIYSGDPVRVSVTGSTFFNNQADDFGGAILVAGEGSSLDMLDCVIRMNTSGSTGGGLYLSRSTATVSNCEFSGNIAEYTGGAIDSADASQLDISESTFTENQGFSGGAVGIGPRADATIVNSLITHNRTSSWGGAVLIYGGDVLLGNCTFSRNYSGENGTIAMDEVDDSFPLLFAYNLVIWGNTGTSFRIDDGYTQWRNCDVEGFSSEYCISVDPMFVNPDGGDFRLKPGSPCIDAGYGDEAPTTDIEGNPRYDDPATPNTGTGSPLYVDMGAYEYRP